MELSGFPSMMAPPRRSGQALSIRKRLLVLSLLAVLGGYALLIVATALLAMLPPALVVIAMQKWFVKGLVDAEK